MSLSEEDEGIGFTRARRKSDGAMGWINNETEEFLTDEDIEQLRKAQTAPCGIVMGDPLESTEWMSCLYPWYPET